LWGSKGWEWGLEWNKNKKDEKSPKKVVGGPGEKHGQAVFEWLKVKNSGF